MNNIPTAENFRNNYSFYEKYKIMEKPSFIGFCYWLLDNPIALAFIILTWANVVIQAILFFKKEK